MIQVSSSAFLSVLLLLSTVKLNAQTVQPNVPTAICKYFFVSQEHVYHNIGISDATNNAITLQKDDSEAREFLDTSLKLIIDSVNHYTSLNLLPVETLKDKIKYSRTGFPLSTLKNAAKNGNYQQYVTVEITIFPGKTTTTTNSTGASLGLSGQVNGTTIEGQQTNTTVKYFPKVKVTLKFGDSVGKKLEKYRGVYTHDEKVTTQTDSRDLTFKGKNGSLTYSEILDQDADQIPYFDFLSKAVEELIKQLPKN